MGQVHWAESALDDLKELFSRLTNGTKHNGISIDNARRANASRTSGENSNSPGEMRSIIPRAGLDRPVAAVRA
jgi:hypothetical protein